MSEIKMTPALHAALIRLRDADNKKEAAPGVIHPRTKAERDAAHAAYAAYEEWREAADDVCAILNPEIER
jgi:hypothetical protein